jgi:hypothetical protein
VLGSSPTVGGGGYGSPFGADELVATRSPGIAPHLVSSSEGPVPRVPRDGGLSRDWLFYTFGEMPTSSASAYAVDEGGVGSHR